jgi:hypothetical protein
MNKFESPGALLNHHKVETTLDYRHLMSRIASHALPAYHPEGLPLVAVDQFGPFGIYVREHGKRAIAYATCIRINLLAHSVHYGYHERNSALQSSVRRIYKSKPPGDCLRFPLLLLTNYLYAYSSWLISPAPSAPC